MPHKGRRFTAKEDRQAKHIAASERARGMSAKRARSVGYATVQKRRQESFSFPAHEKKSTALAVRHPAPAAKRSRKLAQIERKLEQAHRAEGRAIHRLEGVAQFHQLTGDDMAAKRTQLAVIPRGEVVVPRSMVAKGKGKGAVSPRRRRGGGMTMSVIVRDALVAGGKAVLYVELQQTGSYDPEVAQAIMGGLGALGMASSNKLAKEVGRSMVDTAEFLFAVDKYEEWKASRQGVGVPKPVPAGQGANR